MTNFILAPDSFKGTLCAEKLCDIMEKAIRAHLPDAKVVKVPMSDGGEGLVDSFLRIRKGRRIQTAVKGPCFETVPCEYGILEDGTAIIEMASCAGLPLVYGREDPSRTTTYGVGELILHAEQHGAKRIILGLGGSATNDGGIGMACALGYRFLDQYGCPVTPVGGSLNDIRTLIPPGTLPRIPVAGACDVSNPLCGPDGAAFTFGGQKGASPDMQAELDRGLKNLSDVIRRDLNFDVLMTPGSGAAGGMGAAVLAFLHGELKPGIQLILDAAEFDSLLDHADYVITGEGRIDWQSVFGKVPVGVAERAKRKGVPCFALCGSVGKDAEKVYGHGITAVFSSINRPASFQEIAQTSEEDFYFLADALIRTLIGTNIATNPGPV